MSILNLFFIISNPSVKKKNQIIHQLNIPLKKEKLFQIIFQYKILFLYKNLVSEKKIPDQLYVISFHI